jgi:hypothetical protein
MTHRLRVWCWALVLGSVLAPAARGDELIRNGNFEQGNKEFRTAYKHSPGSVLDALTYDVVTDPSTAHRDAASFGDHTSGKGHMLVVNGGNAADRAVWEQTVEVRPGAEYTFSLWVATWYALSPAELDVHINGKSVGKVTAPEKCGEWKQLKVKWEPGTTRSAKIEIFDLNTDVAGNDFALDDISLQGPPAAPLPPDAAKRIQEFEVEAEAIRKRAEAEIQARRCKLIEDLEALHESYTKAGKGDEAATIRRRIRELKGEREKPKVVD